MNTHYTAEKNIEILISLMKIHQVRKVIASPGSTNATFIASLQQDSYFQIFSAPDERSAAYIACGMAAESGEPVVISCTGATASRNYVSGLTEAYYRKLPILAITSTQHRGQIGQYIPQVIDRTVEMNDIANLSVQIPIIHDEMDAWSVNVALNNALLELRHRGGGPVHIDLTTSYPQSPIDLSVKELPKARGIFRISKDNPVPDLLGKRIGIFIGNHNKMTDDLINSIDEFCLQYNAVVLCDQTSNYTGKFAVSVSLLASQDIYYSDCLEMDVLIHIGQVSGAYVSFNAKQVWRVSPDGIIRDTFKRLKYVFEMNEQEFFESYFTNDNIDKKESYYHAWCQELHELRTKIPELPFSNIWIAQKTFKKLPTQSFLYLGILNSLRAWNFCDIRKDITVFSNTGGFGIDGGLSSLLGGALTHADSIHYEILGDLAFFYDMNVLGNRYITPNIRILLINNGRGTEFRNYTHFASKFGDNADKFIAAGGHYGEKSNILVKHYAEDLGFEYMAAHTKDEYSKLLPKFCNPVVGKKPILIEVFTETSDEDQALKLIRNVGTTTANSMKKKAKNTVKDIIGPKGVGTLKKIIKK